jgi:hypothetical protein
VIRNLLAETEQDLDSGTRKAARFALAKLIGKWSLYLVALLGVGVAVVFWFVIKVLLQPFFGDGVND